MVKVLVTELEFRKAEAVFRHAAQEGLHCQSAPAEERALASAVRSSGARHVVLGVERYTGPLYEALPSGGVIARFGVGHDGLDKELATARGLLCTNTPGALDDSVAEHALNLILAAARHTVPVAAEMRAGCWAPRVGCELRGKTLAIIGCGAIGRRVAGMACRGFGMNVLGCDIAPLNVPELQRDFGFALVVRDFETAVREADFVSLHIPSVPATHHFMNAARLACLPARAWLINTARGALVDEAALHDALTSGQLAGAALDVFEREPYEPVAADKDLRALPNVILTPHVGSSTREACERMARRALQNIRLAEAGRFGEMDLLNRDVLARLQPAMPTTP
ncbi:MAG: NAD(P)-dependent oxidoreductase [Verrucomicrobiales bacterium]|nr:NAD(P)-dependent oxidoreductase [Verrucomicrobiales bacterium]